MLYVDDIFILFLALCFFFNNTDVFDKSQAMLVDELKRCTALGLTQFNFHPGAAMGSSKEECIERIAQAINHAHQQVPAVCTGTL